MSRIESIDGAQYVISDDGTAYRLTAAPAAESAPAEPTAASPFALAGVSTDKSGKVVTDTRPDVIREAAASAPDGKRDEWARQAARIHRVPGYSCTVDVTVGGVSMAAHGYAHASKSAPSGAPCKGVGCKGKVR